MIEVGALPPDERGAATELADVERFFTEGDPRMHALWRISLARQIQPRLLRRLAVDDLLFLAGQNSTGYRQEMTEGIDLWANKISQNSERARIELDRRARRTGLWHGLLTALTGAIAGSALTIAVAQLL